MPEIYEKDEAMDGKQEAKEGKKAPLWSIVIIWYGASVLCTNSSKTLTINGWSSNGITFAQLLFSVICSSVVALFGGFHYVPLQSRDEIIQTATISFFFVLGFITMNIAFSMMHVSLVMTLRATEALFTALVIHFFRPSDGLTVKTALALIPVIVGAGLSAGGSVDTTVVGILVVGVCNFCFAFRGLFTKSVKDAYKRDDYSLFLNICIIGTCIQFVVYVLSLSVDSLYKLHAERQENAEVEVQGNEDKDKDSSDTSGIISSTFQAISMQMKDQDMLNTLIINGMTFWLYLQMSWVALDRVDAITHSVLNALRRPVICLYGLFIFGGDITVLNISGIILASGGVLLYSYVKRFAARDVHVHREAIAESPLPSPYRSV